MNCADITPLILTCNEEANLGRVLDRLRVFPKVLIVDSVSTDATREIARGFANVTFVQRTFDNHTAQWNYGLDLITTEWALTLDADYLAPQGLAAELETVAPSEEISAFYGSFRYCVFGKPLRGTLYPARALLFRPARCRYEQDGHTQLLKIEGPTATLQSVFDHDDHKPLSRWLASQDRYAALEAAKLSAADPRTLPLQDRLRRGTVLAVPVVFLYTLLVKGALLDGWRGWFYTLQRTLAEIILALKLLELRLQPHRSAKGDAPTLPS